MPLLTMENLVNLKCDQTGYIECYISLWIWRCIPFTLIAVGVVGNALNMAVLFRKHLRKNSTSIYLIFLAASDTTLLVIGTLAQTLRNVFGVEFYNSTFSCPVSRWIIWSAGIISCWLIVLVTAERTLVTLFPVRAKLKMTPRNALIASVSLVLFSGILSGHLLYGYTLKEEEVNYVTNDSENSTTIFKSCSLRSGEYTAFYNTIWGFVPLVTSSLIPVTLIVTGNAIVGISLIKRGRALRRIHQYDSFFRANDVPQTRQVFGTKMFFILCGVYIFTTVPFGVYFATLEFNKEVNERTLATQQLLHIVMKCLIWSNFSFNYFLYFMTGSLFKKEFRNMIGELHKRIAGLTGRSARLSSVHPVNSNMIRHQETLC